jgi:hypothetical protein
MNTAQKQFSVTGVSLKKTTVLSMVAAALRRLLKQVLNLSQLHRAKRASLQGRWQKHPQTMAEVKARVPLQVKLFFHTSTT